MEGYDRGVALLREDPTSLRALELVGKISGTTRFQLEYNGITRLTDLENLTEKELIRWPLFGKKSVAALFALLSEYKRTLETSSDLRRTDPIRTSRSLGARGRIAYLLRWTSQESSGIPTNIAKIATVPTHSPA